MDIGNKLKTARINSNLTQEQVAEKIFVSRQTISNWENNKTYPDIISIIKLSDIYQISLDMMLKGDENMLKHLQDSTNVVKSNKKLIIAIISNILLLIVLIIFSSIIPNNKYYMVGVFILSIISSSILLHQIIKRI